MCKFVEMNKENHIRSLGGSSRAKMLWTMGEAKGKSDEYYSPAHEQKIMNWNVFRLELWTKHLQTLGSS